MSLLTARDDGQAAAEALLKAIEAFKGRLSSRIVRMAAEVTTTGGRIDSSAANISRVDELVALMKTEFLDDELAEAIIAYIGTLEGIGQEVIDAFEEFDAEVDEDVVDAIDRRYRATVAAYVADPDTYNESLWNRVSSAMIFGIATNAVLGETLGTITEAVDTAAMDGDVVQVVESAPLEMQRMATAAVADAVGAQFFLYQGRPIKTTRPFCAEREGRVWHREEIAEWGRQAAAGVDLDGDGNPGWAGMVDGTNEQTIFVHLGGWYGGRSSCRHVLIPLPRFRVPEEDLARMRAKGLIQ